MEAQKQQHLQHFRRCTLVAFRSHMPHDMRHPGMRLVAAAAAAAAPAPALAPDSRETLGRFLSESAIV